MRVLVTGGCGFIGRHVVRTALDAGHEVTVLDSLRPDVHPTALAPQDDVPLVVGDVRDAALLDRVLPGVDSVVHLAAKVGLGVDIGDLPDYASSNDVGTAQLLAAMARADLGSLTLAGSMVVYGEGTGRCPVHGSIPVGPRSAEQLAAGNFESPCPECGAELAPELVPESAATDPRNAYATSKLAQEHYATGWARDTGGSLSILRYHNVYGPGMPAHTPYAGVASLFTAMIAQGRAPSVFEDGGQRRDFIHVRDIARATVVAAEAAASGTTGVYNVGTGVARTVLDLACSLANAMGGPRPVVTGEFRLGDVRHITADSTRIRRELGWAPREDFDQGMAELGLGGNGDPA